MDGRWGGGAVLETLTSADKFSKVMPIENGEDGLVTYDNKATTKIKNKKTNQSPITKCHLQLCILNTEMPTSQPLKSGDFFFRGKPPNPLPPKKNRLADPPSHKIDPGPPSFYKHL